MFDAVLAQQTALLAEQQKAWWRLTRFPAIVQSALETRVGTTPHDVVYQAGTLRLMRYRRETPATQPEPMLFCYALINRPYILDLQPDKSVVKRFLEQGFEVYMIDWGIPSEADHVLTLRNYVCDLLAGVVAHVLRERGSRSLHLLGYCMGGTLATLFTALNPELVETLTLLASPIDFGGRESLLNLWSDRKYFDVDHSSTPTATARRPSFSSASCIRGPCRTCSRRASSFTNRWATRASSPTTLRWSAG